MLLPLVHWVLAAQKTLLACRSNLAHHPFAICHVRILVQTLNPLRLALHQNGEARASGASDEGPTSPSDASLPPPEPSAQSPTPQAARRGRHSLAELQTVARFLRSSKIPTQTIGVILCDNHPESQDLLRVLTEQFDFRGEPVAGA